MISLKDIQLNQYNKHKITHEIQNEICKCLLCQRLVSEKKMIVESLQQSKYEQYNIEMSLTGEFQNEYIKYLLSFLTVPYIKRKIRFAIPQTCVFEKAIPTCLLIKKKDKDQLKIVKKQQKLNFYEIKKFLADGYIYHNKQMLLKNQNKFDDQNNKLIKKNELIVIARYKNSVNDEILSNENLQYLFKSNQKSFRRKLLYLQTLVCTTSYQEIKINVDVNMLLKDPLFIRAKKQILMINSQIRQDHFEFISQIQQFKFQESLASINQKKFLKYLSLKLILLKSFRQDKVMSKCIFKYVKGNLNNYYFVGLDVLHFANRQLIWQNIVNIVYKSVDFPDQKLKLIQRKIDQQKNSKKYNFLQGNKMIQKLENLMYQSYQKDRSEYIGPTLQRLENLQNHRKNNTSLNILPKQINEQQQQPPQKTFRINKKKIARKSNEKNRYIIQ